MKGFAALAAALVLSLPGLAHAMGPAGKGNYINVHGQTLSLTGGTSVLGVAVDWGAFQSKYGAAGTRIGFSQTTFGAMEPLGVLEFGGGPQFHIPIGDRVLVIPSVNLGYRLSTQSAALGVSFGTAVAYRLDSFYLGAEFEAPIWQQDRSSFLPGPNTLNALVGFYY